MKKILNNKSVLQVILGVLTVFATYLTFGFSTISYKNSLFTVAHLVGCVIVGILYLGFDRVSSLDEKGYLKDIDIFNRIMLYVTLLFLLGGVFEYVVGDSQLYMLVSRILFFGIFLAIHIRKKNKLLNWSVVTRNWRLYILLVLVAVLMYEPTMFSTRWDSKLYYGDFSHINIYSISDMSFFGHLAQGAGIFVKFFISIAFGNINVGIYLANLCSMILGIMAFNGAVKKTVPDKSERIYLLLTLGYAFLPCVLGLSSYINVDIFIINWFMVLVYLYVSEKYFLFSAAGFIYVFTKEPALIIYGGLCVGILMIDFIKCRWNVFKHSRYYGMICVALIWGVTVLINGFWTLPGSGAGVSSSHAGGELKLYFIHNFNWLIWCLAVISGAILIVKKSKVAANCIKIIIPVAISIFLFIGFNLIFVTAINPRYIDNVTVGGYFILAILLLCLDSIGYSAICTIVSSIMCILMLISSYRTIDPVSLTVFNSSKLGDSRMIATANTFAMGDTSVYNKQAQCFEGAYGMAVTDAIENGYTVLIDGTNSLVYETDGMNGAVSLETGYEEYLSLYDTVQKRRTIFENGNTVTYETIAVTDEKSIDECTKENGGYLYLYSDYTDSLNSEYITSNYSDSESVTYSYRGISLYGIRFESK